MPNPGDRKEMKSSLFRKTFLLIISLLVLFFVWRMLRPINIFVVDERFERPIHVETPKGLKSVSARKCGACHDEIYKEWSGSMHAKAWKDPYFQVDFAYDGSQQICLNCHTPLENQQDGLVLGFKDRDKFKPLLKSNPDFDSVLRDEGVTCAACHVKDGRIVGPFETDSAPHPVTVDPEMTSGMKSCIRCHVVMGTRWDTFYRIPPCGTVAEMKEGQVEPDCVGCHMPQVRRPAATGMKERKGRRHLFRGGHHPETIGKALKVEYRKEREGKLTRFIFTITNTGAGHYLPSGTPDRHLTLELKLIDREAVVVKEKVFTMKRQILWRPFIIDLKETRLPYGVLKEYVFEFDDGIKSLKELDVIVRYHLLDEKRRDRIGYKNKEPIAYPVFNLRIPL